MIPLWFWIIQLVLLVLVGGYLLLSPVAKLLFWRYRRRFYKNYQSQANPLPPLTVIKPVKGVDPEVLENYESLLFQDYPAPLQIIFAVEGEDDPIVPLIRQFQRRHPNEDIHLVFSGPNPGIQGKCHNMLRGLQEARYDHIVFSDSDIRIPPNLLREIAAPLQDSTVGASCAPFHYCSRDPLWGSLTNVMIKEGNQAMFASCLLGSCPNLIGGIMALRREALQDIGGLESIAHELMDDVALGKALEEKGYHLVLTPTPCLVIAGEESPSGWFSYNHRWFLGLRTKNPFFFALVLLNPYVLLTGLALLALFLGLPFWPYLALGGGFALFRTLWLWGEEQWTAHRLRQQYDPDTLARLNNLAPARPLLKPLADLSILFFLFSALFWPVVTWRGRRYRIFANGEVASQTT